MSQTRSYTEKTIKILFGQSGNRCAKCRKKVIAPSKVGDPTVVGKIAHIVAFGDEGPRADPSMSRDEVNKLPNLILLCGECHDIVDDQVDEYPAQKLRDIRAAHEAWVDKELEAATPRVTFKELDEVCDGVAVLAGSDDGDLTMIDPAEKIEFNGLGPGASRLIKIGTANDHLVTSFVTGKLETDPDYELRLVAGLKSVYYSCLSRGMSSDSTYYELLATVTRDSSEELVRAAGSSVLSHYFVSCDLFEKDVAA